MSQEATLMVPKPVGIGIGIIFYACTVAFWFYLLNADVLSDVWRVSIVLYLLAFLLANAIKLLVIGVQGFRKSTVVRPMHKWLAFVIGMIGVIVAAFLIISYYYWSSVDVFLLLLIVAPSILVIVYGPLFDAQGQYVGWSKIFSVAKGQAAKAPQSVEPYPPAQRRYLRMRLIFGFCIVIFFILYAFRVLWEPSVTQISPDLSRCLLGVSFMGFWWFNTPLVGEEKHKQTQFWRIVRLCFLLASALFTGVFLARFLLIPQHSLFHIPQHDVFASMYACVSIALLTAAMVLWNSNRTSADEEKQVVTPV